MTDPLVAEAGKKASIGWFAVDAGPAYALWCLAQEDSLYLVTGPDEQELPGISEESIATVTLRGDHGGAVVSYQAMVVRVRPFTGDWEEIAPQLAGKRLNSSGPTGQTVDRWARECAIWALMPASEPLPRDDSGMRAEPRPTSAANITRKPFKLHRVRKRPL